MKRKLMALALTSAMIIGTGITASATNITAPSEGIYGQVMESTSTVEMPTISITVPTAGAGIVVNPYKLTVNDGTEDVTDQIVSVGQEIVNASNVDIQVNIVDMVAVKADGSDMVFATAPITPTIKTKSVFMYMEVGADTDASNEYAFKGFDAKSPSCLAISNKKVTKSNMMVLKAAIDTVTETKGRFKLGGSVVSSPTGTSWAEGDKVTVNYKFTFTPVLPTTN